jgi:hypothetical protein
MAFEMPKEDGVSCTNADIGFMSCPVQGTPTEYGTSLAIARRINVGDGYRHLRLCEDVVSWIAL